MVDTEEEYRSLCSSEHAPTLVPFLRRSYCITVKLCAKGNAVVGILTGLTLVALVSFSHSIPVGFLAILLYLEVVIGAFLISRRSTRGDIGEKEPPSI